MFIKYLVCSNNTINLVLDGKFYVIDPSHRNHAVILKELQLLAPDGERLLKMADPRNAITFYTDGLVQVKDGVVTYLGEPLSDAIVNIINKLMEDGHEPKSFVKFLNNLMNNPSKNSVDQLFNFLEHRGLPITEEGHVIGYKKVRDDYYDWYSGKFLNTPGTTHEMRRNAVDDKADHACSYGFHIGTFQYAAHEFHGGQGRVVLVSFDPKDAVSVPTDCTNQKLRVCKYKVLCDYDGASELPDVLYTAGGESITAKQFNELQEARAPQWDVRCECGDAAHDDYDGEYDEEDDFEDEEEEDYYDDEDECWECGHPESDCRCDD